MGNYEQLLERISRSAGLEEGDIKRKVEAKRAKLSGLISKEGAAQIVAAELGIVFDNERLKISELVQGMKRANVIGKIIKLNEVREFNKNGREGKVASFVLADDSANARVALWDSSHIELIEKGKLKEGDIVEISNASIRNGELHLSSFSDIKKSNEKLSDVVMENSLSEVKIRYVRVGQNIKTRALIMQIFEPRYFNDKNSGEKRAVLNLVLDDGSETIRAVLFGGEINKLGFKDDEIFSLEKFEEKKRDLIGEERYFSGNVRMNSFFNRAEVIINGIDETKVDEVIKELELKIK